MPEFKYDGMSLADFAQMDNQPEITGKYAYAMNLNTGAVIYEKNSNDVCYPASTVKLMTAIVAYENISDLDVEIVASREAVRKTKGANVKIVEGNSYTAKELLNAMLIEGANDAALVLAEYVSGSEVDFCKLMNKKAKDLGAADTNYSNVTGIHADSMVTTARDTGIIAQYFYYIPELFEMSDRVSSSDSDKYRALRNRNKLLLNSQGTNEYYYKNADGMSAGSTEEGGYCVVSAVTAAENQIFLCVVLNSDSEKSSYNDIKKVFDFCCDNFSYKTVASTDNIVCEIPVNNAVDVDHITLSPLEDVKMLLPNDFEYSSDISTEHRLYAESANAPVNNSDAFGEIIVKYKDKVVVGRTKLVSSVSVDKSNVLYFISRIKSIVLSKWVVAFLITAAVLFAIYFGASVYYKYFRKNKYTGNRPR